MPLSFKNWCDILFWVSVFGVILVTVFHRASEEAWALLAVSGGFMWFSLSLSAIEDWKNDYPSEVVIECPI